MKKISLEQELLGVTKRQRENKAFIAATMHAVKRTEAVGTFEQVLRTTSTTKKESFIMRLTRLPRLALMGIATTGVVLVSGTAYAAYQLWTQPSAKITGNSIELRDCREEGERDTLFVDPQSSKSPAEVASILQAHCETSNIQQWAMQSLDVEASDVMLPFTITDIDGTKLTVKENDGNSRTISITKDTHYIVDGVKVGIDKLKQGDAVAYVTDNGKTVRAVVVLGAEATYYSPAVQRLVVTQVACGGNPEELCLQGGGISGIRVDTNGERSTSHPEGWNNKVIEGKLVGYTSKSLTLKASSGAHYTVQTASNLIDTFNAESERNAGLQIKPGDTLNVQYRQPADADKKTITAKQFEQVTLVVVGDAKTGSLQKY